MEGGALCKRPNDLARAVQRVALHYRSTIVDRWGEGMSGLFKRRPLDQSFPLIRRQRIFEPRFIDDPSTMKEKRRMKGGKRYWGYCIGRINDGLSTGRWVINIGEYMCFNRFELPGVGYIVELFS